MTETNLIQLATPFLVFLAVYAFLFASLGRSRIFHFERRARAVLSGVLAFFATQSVLSGGWSQVIGVAALSVTFGLIGILVYHVMLQRGKTKEESYEVVHEDDH